MSKMTYATGLLLQPIDVHNMKAMQYLLRIFYASKPYTIGACSNRTGCSNATSAQKKSYTCIPRNTWFIAIWMVCLLPLPIGAIPYKIQHVIDVLEGTHKEIKKSVKREETTTATISDPVAQDASLEALSSEKQPAAPDAPEGEVPLSLAAPTLSNLQRARLAIDEAIQDATLAKHPATWYYRGVVYDHLLREQPTEATLFLEEALASYVKTMHITPPATQFHSFALSSQAKLWSYYLERGIRYYKQEAFERALEHFSICQRILPNEPTPLLYAAMVYHTKQQPEAAWKNYTAYLQSASPTAFVFRAVAHLLFHQLHAMDAAIDWLDAGLLKFPFDTDLLAEKCSIYQAIGTMDQYIASLQADVEGLPAHLDMHRPLPWKKETWMEWPSAVCSSLAQGKQLDVHQSKRLLGKWYGQAYSPLRTKQDQNETKPNACMKRYAYAYVLQHQGRLEEACKQYQHITHQQPRLFAPLKQLALLKYSQAIQVAKTLKQLQELQATYTNNTDSELSDAVRVWVKPVCMHPLMLDIGFSMLCPTPENQENRGGLNRSLFYQVHVARYGPYVASMAPNAFIFCLESQERGMFCTSPLYAYLAKKIADQLLKQQIHQSICKLEQQLKNGLYFLKRARAEDKKDKEISQALYCSYYHLGFYQSAYRLRQMMERNKQYVYQTDDPFLIKQQE
ncbi:MAG TPA: hypothetical protein VK133_01125 [Amoebophilaceae bacterium]|jgi:tetratricopeptide (TPR) repeat protein|nr:hypothetical protein [Amoebophilaceae bacterium]